MRMEHTSFTSNVFTDKIVGLWEGSFNKATQTTARTSAFLSTLYVHAIPHNFGRPAFPSLLWSNNGGTNWYDGGSLVGGEAVIAFSSSNNMYIASTSNSGNIVYRLVADWINEYDYSDPLVDEFIPQSKHTNFDSRANYQKVSTLGTETYPPGQFSSQITIPIYHGLGYIPNAKVFFESVENELWPIHAGGASNPFLYSSTQDEATMSIGASSVSVNVFRSSNQTRRIWYKVYYD